MREELDDKVNVVASFVMTPQHTVKITPHIMGWKGKRYRLATMGLYHPARRGVKRVHIFEFTCDDIKFRVELDPDSLEWTLKEVFYG